MSNDPRAPMTGTARADGSHRGALGMLGREVVSGVRRTVRDPLALVFALAFPLLFLVTLNIIRPGGDAGGDFVELAMPSVLVFSLASACFVQSAIDTSLARELGILRRVHSTPMPRWVFFAGRVGAACAVSFLSCALLVLVAVVAFRLRTDLVGAAAVLVGVVVGAVCLCTLGIALTILIRTAESAAPMALFLVLPVLFASGIFFPVDYAAGALDTVTSVLPVRPLGLLLRDGFAADGSVSWAWLGVLVAWTALGALVTLRWFSWSPRSVST